MRLTIERLAYGGAGVAAAPDGRTVFVTGGCPGDVVEAEVSEDRGSYLRAHITELHEPSPDREDPRCPYFGTCGGCQWQHISYPVQLAWKRAAVQDALERIGHLSVEVEPALPSPADYGCRNKVELVPDSEGGLIGGLGFARSGSACVIRVDRCLMLPESRSALPKALAGALKFLTGRSRVVVTRVAVRVARDEETAIDIWTPPTSFPRALAAKTIRDATGARSISRVIVRGPASARDVRRVEVLWGRGCWHERLASDRYAVSPPSFFQVNTGAAAALRSVVVQAVRDAEPRHVIDAYAGVGTFTIPLARIAPVTAIEASRYALADLRTNLAEAGLHADILPGDAARVLAGTDGADLIVVDPPRSGLSTEALRALLDASPRRIVYVSCDPATLARDARALAAAGFALTRAVPVDLFPQTYHIETVAQFDR